MQFFIVYIGATKIFQISLYTLYYEMQKIKVGQHDSMSLIWGC
jgi:hypothetical protein